MPVQLTADDAKVSLNAHVASKGAEIRAKFGPAIGWSELRLILADRAFTRYPCEIVFSTDQLQENEFAHPVQLGAQPEDGFTMYVHPLFMTQLSAVPMLVLYQLVLVNYGEFASADDAVTFAACALGMTDDDYYSALCELVDSTCGGSCGS